MYLGDYKPKYIFIIILMDKKVPNLFTVLVGMYIPSLLVMPLSVLLAFLIPIISYLIYMREKKNINKPARYFFQFNNKLLETCIGFRVVGFLFTNKIVVFSFLPFIITR